MNKEALVHWRLLCQIKANMYFLNYIYHPYAEGTPRYHNIYIAKNLQLLNNFITNHAKY